MHVLAIIDRPEDAAGAEHELAEIGLEGVRVFRGEQGGEEIDSSGTEHGIAGRLVRGLQQALSNKDNLAEYDEASRAGATVLAVPVADDTTKDRAVEVLRRHGARSINHFGTMIVTTLEP